MSINYDLWPNPDGQLGKNKIEIPDGVTVTWPDGDALIGNFIYKDGLLSGFVDYKALVANDSKTSHIPYDYAKITLDKSLESTMTFSSAKPEYLIINYTNTTNSGDTIMFKYKGCKTVDDIKAVDPNYLTNDIVDGVWSEGLGDLEDGGRKVSSNGTVTGGMFYYCTPLESFEADLSSLTYGNAMFEYCTNLKSFTSDLSSLTDGSFMFYNSGLESFSSDLSSLTYGNAMFCYCSNLKSFTSDLSSLTYGDGMFEYCKLDTPSVQNIADTINTASNKKLDIGIGNYTPNEQEEAAFNQMVSKGWVVFVNSNYYGGDDGGMYGYTASASLASSAMTLDEIGETEMFNPKPYWAKPFNSDEQNARYVDSEGNFYNILGAQFIYGDNLETYGMFTSLEDAAAQMRLKKIGEEEIETA